MAWGYEDQARLGVEAELERQLDVIAGAIFIEDMFYPGQNLARKKFLDDYRQALEDFLRRWRDLHETPTLK